MVDFAAKHPTPTLFRWWFIRVSARDAFSVHAIANRGCEPEHRTIVLSAILRVETRQEEVDARLQQQAVHPFRPKV